MVTVQFDGTGAAIRITFPMAFSPTATEHPIVLIGGTREIVGSLWAVITPLIQSDETTQKLLIDNEGFYIIGDDFWRSNHASGKNIFPVIAIGKMS